MNIQNAAIMPLQIVFEIILTQVKTMSFSNAQMRSGTKKKPISSHERKTLDILRMALPGYEVFPNMRLADVIKADKYLFNQIKGFHLDFVICDQNSNIVAAVELDDPTHDNQKAQERDAKKDAWLRKADIKLIRIRNPDEANNIRALLANFRQIDSVISVDSPVYTNTKLENNASLNTHFEPLPIHNQQKNQQHFRPSIPGKTERRASRVILKTLVTLLGLAIIFIIFTNIVGSIINKPTKKSMQETSREPETKAQSNTQFSDLQRAQKIAKQLPHYESVWITGKSAKDCANINDGVLDNSTIKCMQGHYEVMDINNPAALHRMLQKP
jgi:very-short-patch-repair endonuclease